MVDPIIYLSMQVHSLNMLTLPHVQVKSYARVRGQRDENDKGYVSISYYKWVSGSYNGSDQYMHFYRLCLLGAFVFLSILTPIVLAKLVSLHYPKIRNKASTGHFMRYLYWAAAGIAFLINVGYIATSLAEQYYYNHPSITSCMFQLSVYKCLIPTDTSVYNDEVLTLVAKCTIVPVAVLIELLISVYTVKNDCDVRQICIGCKRSSLKHYLLLSVETIALWSILMAIQLLAMTVTPLCVLLLIRPQVTITGIIFWLLAPVGFTVIVAYMLYQCQQPRRRSFQSNVRCCGSMCVHFVAINATIGLILTLIVLYEVMLLVQVQIETGVKGIVLSLLPSFPLSALGWYLRKRSQRIKRTQRRSETDLNEEMMQLLPNEDSPCMTQTTDNSDGGDSLPLPA